MVCGSIFAIDETGVRRFALPLLAAAELAGSGCGGGGSSLQPAAPPATRTSVMEQRDLKEIIRCASSADAGTGASCLSRRHLQHLPPGTSRRDPFDPGRPSV